MIKRKDFERYLINNYDCEYIKRGYDYGLLHNGNYATFGNHDRKEVSEGDARRFLKNLRFEEEEYNEICDDWGIPHH